MIESKDIKLSAQVWGLRGVNERKDIIAERIFPVAVGGEISAGSRESKYRAAGGVVGRISESIGPVISICPHQP